MKKSIVTLLSVTIAGFALATPPEISNVRAAQRTGTKLVDITYDAVDTDGDLLKIRVEISDNDGRTYSIPANTFTGDIGDGVNPGMGKKIVWDAGTDWDGEYSDQMRVKIFAIDAQGFPGMEWGNEIPPGGFLLGQDGGAEGSGPSRHVNIPYSYWLSKYEITVGQYCDFLNAAISAGLVYRDAGNSVVYVSDTTNSAYRCCLPGSQLCSIGDSYQIRWNVNKFEIVDDLTSFPVKVTLPGALMFARFYGYDVPTEAEWEKGARGPDNDDQDEHLMFPWGNTISSAYANTSSTLKEIGYYDGNQTPVGPDTINGYGLYDVIGNAAEWTKTRYGVGIESYPTQESQYDRRHNTYVTYNRSVRGNGNGAIYLRNDYKYSNTYGFRVVRRYEAEKWENVRCEIKENFNGWPSGWSSSNDDILSNRVFWKLEGYARDNGAEGSKGVEPCDRLYFPTLVNQLSFVRVKVKNIGVDTRALRLYDDDLNSYVSVSLPATMQSFYTIDLPSPTGNGSNYSFYGYDIVIDDLEIWTTPK